MLSSINYACLEAGCWLPGCVLSTCLLLLKTNSGHEVLWPTVVIVHGFLLVVSRDRGTLSPKPGNGFR